MENPAPHAKPPPAARQPAPRRAAKAPAIVAKKNSPTAAGRHADENVKRNPESPPHELLPPETSRENPPPREPLRENTVIVERPLPTLKDLLPSVTYSAHENTEESPVSLNTTDPKYVTYVGKIKQSIETVWQYPEIALRYGLQGKLALEFTIAGNGQLEALRLTRSSGSSLLDDEALRAIKAAAPFPPIPPWIKPNPLRISATMEYRDSRLDYRFTR
jgi:protein TonB